MPLNAYLSLRSDFALEIHRFPELLKEDEWFDGADEMATIRAKGVE